MGNTHSQVFLNDEELAKKFDDIRTDDPGRVRLHRVWNWAGIQPRRATKVARWLAIGVLAFFMIYIFIKNIPTDVPRRDNRRPQYHDPSTNEQPQIAPAAVSEKTSPPETTSSAVVAPVASPNTAVQTPKSDPSAKNYKGPLNFERLAPSLKGIGKTGQSNVNKNVLFTASNLKSAATLLHFACEMGRARRNSVHFALMSESEIGLDDLKQVNGIDDSCEITFHDARPDFSSESTDERLEASVARAFHYIYMYMHPQAVIVDSSELEDAFFVDGLEKQARVDVVTVIKLPPTRPEKLLWMTKLDRASLAAWNDASLEIVIHVGTGTAGSLIRLLKSLSRADFSSSSLPHITIELPQAVDNPTQRFLSTFKWPPTRVSRNLLDSRQFSLRHRIPSQPMTEDESSVRFVESFWPADPRHSHVLVLSPHVELGPDFFHYVKYALLEYKYSDNAPAQGWDRQLLGISLELPVLYLNESSPFTPPLKRETVENKLDERDVPTPFLWQAPSSNAFLMFGEKWTELHGFIERTLQAQHKDKQVAELLSDKSVSKTHTAWVEHLLRLCRARGYWTLYPSEPFSRLLATVHTEMARAPEEYEADLRQNRDSEGHGPGGKSEWPLASGVSFMDSLPRTGLLWPLRDLPLVAWDGSKTAIALSDFKADILANMADFRRSIGGCHKDDIAPLSVDPSAADLFCTT